MLYSIVLICYWYCYASANLFVHSTTVVIFYNLIFYPFPHKCWPKQSLTNSNPKRYSKTLSAALPPPSMTKITSNLNQLNLLILTSYIRGLVQGWMVRRKYWTCRTCGISWWQRGRSSTVRRVELWFLSWMCRLQRQRGKKSSSSLRRNSHSSLVKLLSLTIKPRKKHSWMRLKTCPNYGSKLAKNRPRTIRVLQPHRPKTYKRK